MQGDLPWYVKVYLVFMILYVIVILIYNVCFIYTNIATNCGWSLDNPACQMIITLDNYFKR